METINIVINSGKWIFREDNMRNFLRFEIDIFNILSSDSISRKSTQNDIYKTRFIFRNKKEIYSPKHFHQELLSKKVRSISLVKNPKFETIPETPFDFDKVCSFQVDYQNKTRLWDMETIWYEDKWFMTFRENSLKKVKHNNEDISECEINLKNAVNAAIDFSNKVECTLFIKDFENALKLLENQDCIEAALFACVFSGMGSWNDIVYSIAEQRCLLSEYNKVTNSLFMSIMDIIGCFCRSIFY